MALLTKVVNAGGGLVGKIKCMMKIAPIETKNNMVGWIRREFQAKNMDLATTMVITGS